MDCRFVRCKVSSASDSRGEELPGVRKTQNRCEALFFLTFANPGGKILSHGEPTHCEFSGDLGTLLKAHKLELIGHSHPGENDPIPSAADREALRQIGQKRSAVVSGRTGKIRIFGQSPFEELEE